ncbi:mannose-6-phosphate class i [Colletotrichum chrysophilum]|uniref:Mannose-6-phosphate class i n=1 Tax=Colletotrichum chrysophilum TaxID=1836956 RepID=A0AAD9AUH5_9PEZI|nr:mannose-6-phosphate class i [Colletotrichum chrysophilum]
MAPIVFPANQPPARFYLGGPQISSFRSDKPSGPNEPEDWIASTTYCLGCARSKLGMTVLPDGRLLADAIAADPEYWLGPGHLAAFGTDTKLLVKLLDAGQRLPVHAHPHRDWAREHVGAKHGKAEAWYLLTPGEVYLGLKEDVTHEELLGLVERQDVEGMLGRMHRLDVKARQTVYVPPGTLHAIREGVFLIEVQEPEDLSILCDWKGFDIDGFKDGHLGLGFEKALTAVDTRKLTRGDVERLVTSDASIGVALPDVAKEYFDLERVEIRGKKMLKSGFAVLVVCEGALEMWVAGEKALDIDRGKTLVVPFGDGDVELKGSGEVVVLRPPRGQ